MKELKRNIALMLALCMVFTGIVPAYADEVTAPEEPVMQQEISDIEISEIINGAETDEAASDDVSYEDETILENIEKATPANADSIESDGVSDNQDTDAFEEATPAKAEYTDEIFIRETVVDGITITLTADPGVFPEEAELWAEQVEDEATEEAIEEAVEKERENDINVAASYKFDIKMFVNSEEVQPDTTRGSVKVTFTLAEELSECLDANAYHLKEDAKGKLTAENLGAEVKTVEEAVEETAAEAGNVSETVKIVRIDEDEVLSDGTIEDDVTKKVTKLEADTDGFSYYEVEFTYKPFTYILVGTSAKLSNILSTLGVIGTPSEATVSNAEYLTVTEDEDSEDWTIKVLQPFSLATMSVTTVTDYTYEINVSNESDSATRQNIQYIDETGETKNQDCIIITSADGYSFEENEWYAVTGNVTIKNRIDNNAPNEKSAHLILTDGCEFNVPKGINNIEWRSLYIYGQANQTGKLNITAPDNNNAGIGGSFNKSGGFITINGGTITATGGNQGAGIGGGFCGNGGTIIINGGNVTARGGRDASGIGLGRQAIGGNVTINGGTINAYGGDRWGKGIGDGERSIKSELMIYAGNSRETAKRSNPEGVDAKYVFISNACYEVNYTVLHQRQKVDSDEYEVHKEETLSGGVGWQTEATANDEDEKYTAQEFSQETIASDGTTKVNIFYNRRIYTITFDTDGRTAAPEPLKAGWGTKINSPTDPECEGYKFEGWYKEKECINPYTFNKMPEENLTLYAKWKVDQSQRQNVQYVDEDGSTKEVSCIILSKDKSAYAFDTGEWYAVTGSFTINNRIENRASEDSPAHLILTDGASLVVKGGIHIPNDKGLVIYGQSIGSGTLSVSDVPGNNDGIGAETGEDYGRITINGGTVTSTGGWGRAGIGGKITINGGTVTSTGAGGGAGIGGAWMGGIGDEISINGGTITATGAGGAAIGAGENGAGWTLVFDCNPAVLKAGPNKDNAVDVDPYTYETNHQNYNYAYLEFGTAKADYTVQHKVQKALFSNEYELKETETKSGYVGTFTKAVTKENEEGYSDYKALDITQKKITADNSVVVEIKYNLIYYTITFDAKGHGTAPELIKACPGTAISEPAIPHELGYHFVAWYTDEAFTEQYEFNTMPARNLTLYAMWTKAKVFTVTWKDWDGKILATSIINGRELPKYPASSKPSRSGYIFTGWTPEIDLATADTTYTATYEKKSSGGGGSGSGGGGGGSAVITYAEKPAVTPITVAANGAQMMGTAVVSIPDAQLAKSGAAPVPGAWSKANGMWTFTKADGNKAKNEWVLITVVGGNASYFYFDSNGNMVTGWQQVGGKWMYFNNESGSLLGACLRGPGRTPDGYEIDASGAWTGR